MGGLPVFTVGTGEIIDVQAGRKKHAQRGMQRKDEAEYK